MNVKSLATKVSVRLFRRSAFTSWADSRAGRGRPSKLRGDKLLELKHIWLSESASLREIAKWLGVSHMTVWRAVNSDEFCELLKV